MATSPPSLVDAPETVTPVTPVDPVAAVVEWAGQDGQPSYLSDASSNPVTFTVDLDCSSKTALLKIRIQLEIRKPVAGKTSLCLYIPPERVHSAALDSSELSTESKRLKGHKLVCVRLELAQLDWLCKSLCRRELSSGGSATDGGGVYEGQNESKTASGSKKRKLSNFATEGVEIGCIERICSKILTEQLGRMETRMKEWVDQRLTEQEKKYEDRLDKLEDQIQDIESHVDDRVWLEVDDLRTGIQDDFDQLRSETEDFIREENRSAVDVIRKQLSESDVNIVGGRAALLN
ncbi:hypothetical protein UCDDA912_g09166 [Diaporthe ampelina]|uniref:Uncharacterized protein n=1 Tax=Diaporthe ampelina TaxID=1214573 RepID=A0A0G2HRY3_9PEZI|nr:hypothetical protein UCDDA912_g09166 [Diaporthe ampelina]